MNENTFVTHSGERRALAVMAAALGILLLVGTFLDEGIAQALYSPHNVPATIVTTVGIYPLTAAIVLFMGTAFQRVAHSQKGKGVKVVLAAACALIGLFVGFVGAASLLDVDCLGGLVPSLNKNYVVAAVLSLTIEWPLFLVGWKLAKRSDDERLLRRAVCLVVVLLAAFAFMQLTKGVFNRPRYRTVAEGLEGVGFVPWYRISPNPAELMARYGLEASEFRSFPSGHAILSISTISTLLSLTWLFPGLREKRVGLCWAGFAFAVVIMFTRMLLGAHYLSDVCAGALIGLGFVFVYDALQRRIA
jgi:membrane-associated phospholipid phosphatase